MLLSERLKGEIVERTLLDVDTAVRDKNRQLNSTCQSF
ncbi:hypothetical protein ACP70R_047225 [Stipagrostis hirtigluma subsp. patula]